MTAKEYLRQAYWLDRRINSRLEMLMSLREMAAKTTGAIQADTVSHTRNVHSLEDTIAKVVDMEKQMNVDIDRLIDLKKEINSVISQVSNIACRMVLEYRYLCYHSWEDIADLMKMHIRNVYKLHGRGLQEVEKILINNPEIGQ